MVGAIITFIRPQPIPNSRGWQGNPYHADLVFMRLSMGKYG
jgi:hypothetical protein